MLNAFRNRPIVRDTFHVLIVQICSKGTLHLVSIAMAQMLLPSEFAKYGFFLVTTAVLAGYLGMGLPLATSKAIAGKQTTSLLHDQIAAIVVLGVAATAIASITAPLYVPVLIPASLDLHGAWVVAGAVGGAWAALGQAALYASHAFNRAIVPVVLGSVVFVAGAVVAAMTGTVAPLLIGAIGSSLLGFAGTVFILRRFDLWPGRRQLRLPTRAGLRTVLVTALPGMGIAAIFVTFNWLIARSLVQHQTSIGEFNMFSIGLQWFALILFVPLALGQAIFPRYIRLAGAERVSLATMLRPVTITSAVLLAAAPLAALATPLLVWFYGGHYRFSHTFVIMVFLAAAVAGAQNLVGTYVIATRGAGIWLAANLATLALCLSLVTIWPPATALRAMLEIVACYTCLACIAFACIHWEARQVRTQSVLPIQEIQ